MVEPLTPSERKDFGNQLIEHGPRSDGRCRAGCDETYPCAKNRLAAAVLIEDGVIPERVERQIKIKPAGTEHHRTLPAGTPIAEATSQTLPKRKNRHEHDTNP